MKRRTVRRKTKNNTGKWWACGCSVLLFFVLAITAYHYRNAIAYYFSFKSNKTVAEKAKIKRLTDLRNREVLVRHSNMLTGIDVSEYQGTIDWPAVKNIDGDIPLHFVFIRATAGKDRPDLRFAENWTNARTNGLVRGAYHYFRPNENSIEQAELFIKTVKLRRGDLPPVLDIEQLPSKQSVDSLKAGLKRWLNRVEVHYGVKPILYSGEKYYSDFLKDEFSDYPLWIANYNFFVENIKDDWLFWQFTERGEIDGVQGPVDVNIFNGTKKELHYLTVGN
jgi:lysozyme